MKTKEPVTIWNREYLPEVGSLIRPDGWRFSERLVESDWSEAEFYLLTGHCVGIQQVAVNITITGRTLQRFDGDLWVRVKIEFVGDGEPSVFHGGWMRA